MLVDATHVYNASLQEGFLTGGSATLSYSDHYLKENAATDVFNPTSAPSLGISVQQNLLRGFGIGVNQRTINVNKINLQTSDLSFKTQVINTVASVLIQYYGLAADYEDLRAKQSALETAQRFFENTRRQEELGALSPLDVTTAQSQVASSQNDLVVSETALRQDELQLKNVLSRTGAMDPALATAQNRDRWTGSRCRTRTIWLRWRIWCGKRWPTAPIWRCRRRTSRRPRSPLWEPRTECCLR